MSEEKYVPVSCIPLRQEYAFGIGTDEERAIAKAWNEIREELLTHSVHLPATPGVEELRKEYPGGGED